jgi:hypothetical protein
MSKSPSTREEDLNPKTYHDLTIDFQRDIFPVLFLVGVGVVILHFAGKPEGAIILLIELFKLPPDTALLLFSMCMPVAMAVLLARMFAIIVNFVFIPLFALATIIILLLILLVSSEIKWRNVIIEGFDRLGKFFQNRIIEKNSGKKIKSNVYALVFCLFFFFGAYFGDNFISRKWQYTRNRELTRAAKLHYYCQLTGAWNQKSCSEAQLSP